MIVYIYAMLKKLLLLYNRTMNIIANSKTFNQIFKKCNV